MEEILESQPERTTRGGAKVFTTVSEDKRSIIKALGATGIDRNTPVNDYVAEHTAGEGLASGSRRRFIDA